jgi:hypothetical protein
MHSHKVIWLFILFVLLLSDCTKKESPPSSSNYENEAQPIIPFVINTNYIELSAIERISRFRSGIGHTYDDDSEQCRSMKHYFQPKASINWSAIKIFSPVRGTVSRIFEEWAGTQLQIQPRGNPEYTVIIFHIATLRTFTVGDTVSEGEQLGTHIGSQTMSDIAVGHSVNNTWRLVSYFDLISDSLFQQYVLRGATSRSQFIITKEARDADPLNCTGDAFANEGTIQNWVELQ